MAKKRQSYYDYSLLILVIFIVAFGLVMVYSASSYTAQVSEKYNYDATYFLMKQARATVLGIVAMLLVSKIDYRLLIKKLPVIKVTPATLLFLFSIILQFMVIFVGIEVNYSKRWLAIGPVTFQPSEITKIAIIVYTAYLVYKAPLALEKIWGFLKICLYLALPIALVAKENMSTAIVLVVIVIGICFVASRKRTYFFVAAPIIAGLGTLFLMFGPGYRLKRVKMWREVETNEDAAQILQGLYAIASGGLFGTGLGQSMQKLGFVPEAYNDMIFSIICEELGLFGAIIVVIMFVLLIWRIFIIAVNAPDLFGALICVGVLVHISVQVLINIAVVTNSIPSTGIPLPFISYGGTSVSILLAEMGLVLSVSNRINAV